MAALNIARQHFVSIDEKSGLQPQNPHLHEDMCANSRAAGVFEQSSLFRPTEAANQKIGGQKPTINIRQLGGVVAKNLKSLGSPRGIQAAPKQHFIPTPTTQDGVT